LLAAFQDFTENPVDPKAAVILTLERVAGINIFLLFKFYDGPTPPTGVFKGFEGIPSISDSSKTQYYGDLVSLVLYKNM
jgi:hypothetical protein